MFFFMTVNQHHPSIVVLIRIIHIHLSMRGSQVFHNVSYEYMVAGDFQKRHMILSFES